MRSHNYFMKAVASLLTVTMSALPIHSYANGSQDRDITAVGKEACAGQNLQTHSSRARDCARWHNLYADVERRSIPNERGVRLMSMIYSRNERDQQ